MHITDPIADMLTRIRNANSAKHDTVDIPASNMKKAIAQILVDEGYIKNYKIIEDGKQGVIRVTLKYGEGKSQVITGLRRVSKPGLRIYSNVEEMPKVLHLSKRVTKRAKCTADKYYVSENELWKETLLTDIQSGNQTLKLWVLISFRSTLLLCLMKTLMKPKKQTDLLQAE